MLDDRKLAVLRAIVTDYVASREPVGSKALVERHQLNVSAATVRNDMVVLEEEGYITQPHTSAGRIPTDKGYRLFVDRLGSVKPLSRAERGAITTFLAGAVDLDDIVTRTVRLLAQVTSQVAIVQYPVANSSVVRQLDLIRLHDSRGLLLVIDSLGKVVQRTIDLGPAGDDDLALVRDRVNETIAGVSYRQIPERVVALTERIAPEIRGLAQGVVAALLDIVATEPASRVVVGGISNVTAFSDRFEVTIKPMLEALEEQMVLLRLLGEASGEVKVRIGQENEHASLTSASVVASGYGTDEDNWAGLGVVGPTRMDYPSTMASVRAVARYVSQILAEG
ncbi:MAG: heat-inducible transcriptional repressor HrcA [Propionibacteriaceae bacterium]|jgi:heat-inducible transcriptional repressor|nr:heat-inducible transcriptional repressor HrcA [Propionibacteriaceae bacterium]